MARMHSGAKGKAGSQKPLKSDLSWVRYKGKEIETLVQKLAKKGLPPSQIGMRLRDEYGIPDVQELTGKKVAQITTKKGETQKLPEDLNALIRTFIIVQKHYQKNRKDTGAKRGEQLAFSKIKRLGKYYRRVGRLPVTWQFNPKDAEMMLQ